VAADSRATKTVSRWAACRSFGSCGRPGRGAAPYVPSASWAESHAEVYYLDGKPRRAGAGSSRADAIIGPLDRPLLAVELKTSNARLTRRQYRAYGRNLPPGTSVLLLRLEAAD
jgi:hypothetical protein